MNTVTIPDLTEPQKRMLLAANRRYGRETRSGMDLNYTNVRRGQSSTAKALRRMNLGGYVSDDGIQGAKFWIWKDGHEVAEAILAEEAK